MASTTFNPSARVCARVRSDVPCAVTMTVAVFTCGDVLRDGDALRLQAAEDGGVVDQVAEDRQRSGVGVVERECDGVADAEAHAEVGRAKDSHTGNASIYRELCNVKYAT